MNYFIRKVEFVSFIICAVFSFVLILHVVGPGDGTWYFISKEIISGKGIYKDLGIVAQPLFPLINTIPLLISDSLISQKSIYIVSSIVFAFVIYKVATLSTKNHILNAILILLFFSTSIRFVAFRFDDYHVIANLFVLLSYYFSYQYLNFRISITRFIFLQSIFFVLTFTVRLNEGLAVFFSVLSVIIISKTEIRKLRFNIVASIAIVSTIFICILAIIGETPFTWINSTLLKASQAKGGSSMFFTALNLFTNSFIFLKQNSKFGLWICIILIFIISFPGLAFRLLFKKACKDSAAVFLQIFTLIVFLASLRSVELIDIFTSLTVIILFLKAMSFTIQFYNHNCCNNAVKFEYPKNYSLYSYSFFLFIFSSLSSGGHFFGLYSPLAYFFLAYFQNSVNLYYTQRKFLAVISISTFTIFAIFNNFTFKFNNPYSWHDYHVNRLFSNYIPVYNSLFERHILTNDLYNLVQNLCPNVSQNSSLLSLPFPFANYYCNIPVWNGYIQTFFDTTPHSVIDQLINDLDRKPPDFIVYQRQMENLRMHEITFNGGKTLPQRKLDSLIRYNIDNRLWDIVYENKSYLPSIFYLIKTNGVTLLPPENY